MAKVKDELDYYDETKKTGRLYIWCPACYETYSKLYPNDERFWINGALHCLDKSIWQFNDNYDAPTFQPSVLYMCNYGEDKKQYVCHSYILNGMIEYLQDCTHSMANQIVPLMNCPKE